MAKEDSGGSQIKFKDPSKIGKGELSGVNRIISSPDIDVVASTLVYNGATRIDNVDQLSRVMQETTLNHWKEGHVRRITKVPHPPGLVWVTQSTEEQTAMTISYQAEKMGATTLTLTFWDAPLETLTSNSALIPHQALGGKPNTSCGLRAFWTGSVLLWLFFLGKACRRSRMVAFNGNLETMWSIPRKRTSAEVVLSSTFVTLFSYRLMWDTPVLVDGFDLATGNVLFSLTIQKGYARSPRLKGAHSHWLVYSTCEYTDKNRIVPSKLYVVNSQTKTVKVLRHLKKDVGQLIHLWVKDGHVASLHDGGDVLIRRLQTGRLVKRFSTNGWTDCRLSLVEFCPTDGVLCLLGNAKGYRLKSGFAVCARYFDGHIIQVFQNRKQNKRSYFYQYSVRVFRVTDSEPRYSYVLFESKQTYSVRVMTPHLLVMMNCKSILIFDFLNPKLYEKF